jgi:RNA polymerase sigma-70 factor (ECF subfamily)
MWQRPLTREFDVREAYALHSDDLYGFAVRALGEVGLAEEALEETFLRAWRARDRFDPEIDTVRSWLFAILREVMIEGIDRSVEPREQSPRVWQVEEAMRRIGKQYRQALVETYYRGRPCAEIAIELGIPEATVRSRVYDGLRALQEALEEVGFES